MVAESSKEMPRMVPALQIHYAPICIDPEQVNVLAHDYPDAVTLADYIRAVAREEAESVARRQASE